MRPAQPEESKPVLSATPVAVEGAERLSPGQRATPQAPFNGFPNSGLATAVPNLFFSDLLPAITEPEELIVTTYFFFAVQQQRRNPRFVTLAELQADGALARALVNLFPPTTPVSLKADPQGGGEGSISSAIPRGSGFNLTGGISPRGSGFNLTRGGDGGSLERGLNLALQRGTLLRATIRTPDREETIFAVNNPANRRALGSLEGADVRIESPLPAASGEAAPNIYALYEENIGTVTPLIAEDLREAEERYPPEWVREAMREAVELNKRSWRYIATILRRWETEGPSYEKAGRDTEAEWLERRYREGKRRLRSGS